MNKKLLLLFIILGICRSNSIAQILFERYYGITGQNNVGSYFQILPDGSYLLSGSSDGEGLVYKIDSSGNQQWSRTYPDATSDCIKTLPNGDFYMAGSYEVNPPPTAWITHCDSAGNLIFNTSLNSLPFSRYGVAVEPIDYQHIGFLDNDFYPFQEFLRLHGYDSLGNHMWDYPIGKVSDCSNSALRKTNDGYVVACGSFDTPYPHLRVCRIDSLGTGLWNKDFAYDSIAQTGQSAWSVCTTSDSGFMVAGYRMYGSPSIHYRLFLMKLNSAGDSLWSKEYDLRNSNSFKSIQQTNDGGFIIAGTVVYPTSGSFFDYRAILIKTDSYGDTLWTKEFPGYGLTEGRHVEVAPDGGIALLSTTTDQTTGETYFYFTRTDSTGSLITKSNEISVSGKISVYPNPAIDYITIQSTDFENDGVIKIKNLTGEILIQATITNFNTIISIKDLAPGIYFSEINLNGKARKIIKFIKI